MLYYVRTQSTPMERNSYVRIIVSAPYLSLRRSLHSRDLLVQRQDVRHRAQRRDGEWVDLAVTLGVVLLDVSELGRAAEGLVVPVEVAQPPEGESQYWQWVEHLSGRPYLWRLE